MYSRKSIIHSGTVDWGHPSPLAYSEQRVPYGQISVVVQKSVRRNPGGFDAHGFVLVVFLPDTRFFVARNTERAEVEEAARALSQKASITWNSSEEEIETVVF